MLQNKDIPICKIIHNAGSYGSGNNVLVRHRQYVRGIEVHPILQVDNVR